MKCHPVEQISRPPHSALSLAAERIPTFATTPRRLPRPASASSPRGPQMPSAEPHSPSTTALSKHSAVPTDGIGCSAGLALLAASPIGLAPADPGRRALFLGWFGIRSPQCLARQRRPWRDPPQRWGQERAGYDPRRTPCSIPTSTWIPLMLLGSFGSQFAEELRPAFAAGAMLASSGLVLRTGVRGGGILPWLAWGRVQQAIDLVVGLIMLVLAVKLALVPYRPHEVIFVPGFIQNESWCHLLTYSSVKFPALVKRYS